MPRKPANFTDADKLRRHQRIIIDLGLLATQALSLDNFLSHAVAQLAMALEVSNTKIMRYRPEVGDLLLTSGIGWKKGVVGQATFNIDLESPPGAAFQTGEPVVINDLNATSQYVPSPSLKEHGIVSVVNVPILINNAAWGVLEADSVELREFGQDTVDFMLALSRMVASVVQRHQVEEAHQQALGQVAREVRERSLMLAEMQHRVKNYFQLILAMIAVERPKLPTKDGQAIMSKVAERIMAVSLANDQLTPGEQNQTVSMATYLRALCTSLDAQRDGVSIGVKADEISMPSDRAVPVGLIVNELVTNSLKYAFAEREGGAVLVELSAGAGGGRTVLVVSDNGRGFDPEQVSGTGLRLIRALARQIAGVVEQETSPEGTTTRVTFIDGQ
jgi:two-component system, sensor histidine kinase PdtaS